MSLIVRESLSRLCLHLCGRFPGARPSRRDPDTERVQLMLSRIRESADGPLTLSDIAGAAGWASASASAPSSACWA